MTNLLPILAVAALAGVGVLGDYFIKLSGNGSKYISYPYFFTGMAVYALTAIGWFYTMKHIKLSSLGIIYSLTTVILLTIIGVLLFREKLNIYDIVGIVLGITSIFILARLW